MKRVRNSIIYLGSTLFNQAIPVLILPIITAYLSPAEYGTFAIYKLIIATLIPVIGMVLDANITRNQFLQSEGRIKDTVTTVYGILTANFLIVTLIVILLISIFGRMFDIDTEYLYLITVIVFSQIVNKIFLTISRNDEKPILYGIFQVSLTAVYLFTTLFILIQLNMGWASFVYGLLFSNILFAIIGTFLLVRGGYLFGSLKGAAEIYKFSFPLIFHAMGGLLLVFSDRIIIDHYLGKEPVGLYSIAFQFGILMQLITNSIINSITPDHYRLLNKADDSEAEAIALKSFERKIILIFIAIAIPIALSLVLIFPFVVDEAYHGAERYIPWFILAYLFRGIYQVNYNRLIQQNRSHLISISTISAMLLNVALNLIFVKTYGIAAAAISSAIAFLLMMWMTTIFSRAGKTDTQIEYGQSNHQEK